jgi:hypothetical protein
MENEFQMSMTGELTFFLKYPSESNEGRHLHTSSQVHERLDEEVQHGRAQARVNSNEHGNGVRSR